MFNLPQFFLRAYEDFTLNQMLLYVGATGGENSCYFNDYLELERNIEKRRNRDKGKW
jgi:hypothetical protein